MYVILRCFKNRAPGLDKARTLQTLAQKPHFAVLAHKTDVFIDKTSAITFLYVTTFSNYIVEKSLTYLIPNILLQAYNFDVVLVVAPQVQS